MIILILLELGLYWLIQKIVITPFFSKKIKNGISVKNAIGHKTTLLRWRMRCLSAIILLCSIIVVVGIFEFGDSSWEIIINLTFYTVVLYFMIWDTRKHSKILGNISVITARDFLLDKPVYSLYLRAFKDDKTAVFDESLFVEILNAKELWPVCAIGMTKETDSPLGAIRVYTEDNTWKIDAEILIRNARNIYILVNNRESCIWEIEHCIPYLKKTTFVIYDTRKYDEVRAIIKEKICFPSLPPLSSGKLNVLSYKDSFSYKCCDKTMEGYTELLDIDHKDISKVYSTFYRNRRLKSGFIYRIYPLSVFLKEYPSNFHFLRIGLHFFSLFSFFMLFLPNMLYGTSGIYWVIAVIVSKTLEIILRVTKI